MKANKAVIMDTADFYLYDEEGKKIVELKTTKGVSVFKEDCKTFIQVEDALLDTAMLNVLGKEKEEDLSDFEKDIGINHKQKKVSMSAYDDHSVRKPRYKALVKTVACNPDTMAVAQKVDMSFPQITLSNSVFGEFVSGEAYVPTYLFRVEKDYDVTLTDV